MQNCSYCVSRVPKIPIINITAIIFSSRTLENAIDVSAQLQSDSKLTTLSSVTNNYQCTECCASAVWPESPSAVEVGEKDQLGGNGKQDEA